MRRIELQRRTADMFTGREDLEPLQTVADFPVYCGVAEGAPEDDLAADMEWMISRGSGMVQLGGLVPAELLYSKSHNASVGGIWRRHHEEFAEFLHKYAAGDIVEIGGGNGVLNAIYCARYRPGCAWTIIDPTDVELADGVSARYVRRMWDGDVDFARDGIGCGTLVHSHLMEHQYDLRGFMGLNAQRLGEGRRMVFSLPDLKEWLRRKYSNALFFEHTYLITEDYADAILGEYGFRILAKEHFGDGHSIFYATERAHGGGISRQGDGLRRTVRGKLQAVPGVRGAHQGLRGEGGQVRRGGPGRRVALRGAHLLAAAAPERAGRGPHKGDTRQRRAQAGREAVRDGPHGVPAKRPREGGAAQADPERGGVHAGDKGRRPAEHQPGDRDTGVER